MSGCLDVQYVPGQFYSFQEENLRGVCSSQGICNETTNACECNEGWTGLSDFFGDPGTDCQITILGIQIIYGLMIFITLGSLVTSLSGLKKRWADYQQAKEKAKRRGQKYKFYNNRALFCLFFWYTFGFPSLIIACLLRIFALQERVGVTAAMTFFFAVTKIAFYISIVVYQPFLFSTLVKGDSSKVGQTEASNFFRFVSISAGFGCFFGIVSSLIPFFSIGNPAAAPAVYSAYYLVSGGGLIYNGIVAFLVYRKAEKVLSRSYEASKSESILLLKQQIQKLQFGIVINANMVGLIYVLMMIWPFWWNMHEYFQPLTWLAIIKTAKDTATGAGEGKKKSGGTAGSGSLVGNSGTANTVGTDEGTDEPKSISESV